MLDWVSESDDGFYSTTWEEYDTSCMSRAMCRRVLIFWSRELKALAPINSYPDGADLMLD